MEFKEKYKYLESLSGDEFRIQLAQLNASRLLDHQALIREKKEKKAQALRDLTLSNKLARLFEIREEKARKLAAEKLAEDRMTPEEKKHRMLKQLRDELVSEIHAIQKECVFPSYITPDKPSVLDHRLAKKWCSGDESEKTLNRMLSARLAEMALSYYFENLGFHVDDIAASQLNGSGSDWKLYDLRITNPEGETFYVDVKNSRRSEKNPQNYTSHCVPEFKEVTRNALLAQVKNEKVLIAGALSEWQNPDEIRIAPKQILFLGVTGVRSLDKLVHEFESGRFEVIFELNTEGKTLLPPWVFESPRMCYKNRDHKFSTFDVSKYGELENDPYYASILLATKSAIKTTGHRMNDFFLKTVSERIGRHGLRLSMLYPSILEHFVESLVYTEQDGFDCDFIKSVLGLENSRSCKTPLFIYDPTESVHSLIKALKILWENRNDVLVDIRVFKLLNLNILRGQKKCAGSDSWITLLAYCGGYYEGRPCGKTPLVIGHEKCKACKYGRLICPNCHYCCQKCEKEEEIRIKNQDIVFD